MEEETPKTDFYIKLASEADMPTVLTPFYHQDTETLVDGETWEETVVNVGDPYMLLSCVDYAIDIVGIISKPTGNILTDADGNEYPEQAPIDGWHINIRLLNDTFREVTEAIDLTNGTSPVTPSRVWL
jgi:hypothetical protein